MEQGWSGLVAFSQRPQGKVLRLALPTPRPHAPSRHFCGHTVLFHAITHTSADTGDSSLKATFQPFSAGRMFSQMAALVACPRPPQQRPRRVLHHVRPAVAAFFQPGVPVPKESVQVQGGAGLRIAAE